MKRWIALIFLVSIVLAGFIWLLLSSPYDREAVGGLIVASACLLLFAGIFVGAGWTAIAMRAGGRLASPGHVANQRADTQRLHLLRDALRFTRPGPEPANYEAQPQAWLPPLTQFDDVDDIVDADFEQD